MDLQRCRSRELRGGILYTSCGCTRRNGLQYDCPRSECQGRRVCLKKPYPKCCASMYGNRFGNISMGKSTDPVGARQIRVFNNGGENFAFINELICGWWKSFFFILFFAFSMLHSIWSMRWTERLQRYESMRSTNNQVPTVNTKSNGYRNTLSEETHHTMANIIHQKA